MALLYKPHSVYVYAIAESFDYTGNVTAPPSYPIGVTVRGQLTPYTGRSAKFDTKSGVQLTNPHIFYCDMKDLPNFQYGYRVVYGSRSFTVTESPNLWDAGGVTKAVQHSVVQLEELELA